MIHNGKSIIWGLILEKEQSERARAVALNLGLSAVAIVASMVAVSLVYKMRKLAH